MLLRNQCLQACECRYKYYVCQDDGTCVTHGFVAAAVESACVSNVYALFVCTIGCMSTVFCILCDMGTIIPLVHSHFNTYFIIAFWTCSRSCVLIAILPRSCRITYIAGQTCKDRSFYCTCEFLQITTTVELLLWDTSIKGTPPLKGHFSWSRQNAHIIFVFTTSI